MTCVLLFVYIYISVESLKRTFPMGNRRREPPMRAYIHITWFTNNGTRVHDGISRYSFVRRNVTHALVHMYMHIACNIGHASTD